MRHSGCVGHGDVHRFVESGTGRHAGCDVAYAVDHCFGESGDGAGLGTGGCGVGGNRASLRQDVVARPRYEGGRVGHGGNRVRAAVDRIKDRFGLRHGGGVGHGDVHRFIEA